MRDTLAVPAGKDHNRTLAPSADHSAIKDLLENRAMRRLADVAQLGLYPYLSIARRTGDSVGSTETGPAHSRLAHSKGVAAYCQRIAATIAYVDTHGRPLLRDGRRIGLPDRERGLVYTAGLVHDVAQPPFSHSTESEGERLEFHWDHDAKAIPQLEMAQAEPIVRKMGFGLEELGDALRTPNPWAVIVKAYGDRFDYLLRDLVALKADPIFIRKTADATKEIIANLVIQFDSAKQPLVEGKIAVREKAQDALRQVAAARNYVYERCGLLPARLAIDAFLVDVIEGVLTKDWNGREFIEEFRWKGDQDLLNVLPQTPSTLIQSRRFDLEFKPLHSFSFSSIREGRASRIIAEHGEFRRAVKGLPSVQAADKAHFAQYGMPATVAFTSPASAKTLNYALMSNRGKITPFPLQCDLGDEKSMLGVWVHSNVPQATQLKMRSDIAQMMGEFYLPRLELRREVLPPVI
jgi:HD superfamily phosphohydrolase